MATLGFFGEQFASKVLERTYQDAVFMAITNRDYEGDIKKPGDRVNILSFLNTIKLSDYAVGTDMSSEAIIDTEDQLIVEKRKYFNFSLDRLEDLFTYGGDIPDNLITDAKKQLEISIDQYVLYTVGQEAKAGNWVGTNFLVTGATATMASLTTSATGGDISIVFDSTNVDSQTSSNSVENPLDGIVYNGGFQTTDLYKGIRLLSTRAFVTPWYRISGVTNTVTITVTEWDGATSGSDFEEGYTLRGTFGGDGVNFPKYGAGDASLLATSGLGWEVQAAIATAISATSIYKQVTLLAQALDDNEVANDSRHFVCPPSVMTMFRQSAELQPTGIAELYLGTVVNGRIMRVGAFDVHQAASPRLSTRASRGTGAGIGPSTVITTGTTGYIMPANHIGFMTYADKWAETRVVDAENQFARKYQGLFLFGAKVPSYRRKYGAVLLGSV